MPSCLAMSRDRFRNLALLELELEEVSRFLDVFIIANLCNKLSDNCEQDGSENTMM